MQTLEDLPFFLVAFIHDWRNILSGRVRRESHLSKTLFIEIGGFQPSFIFGPLKIFNEGEDPFAGPSIGFMGPYSVVINWCPKSNGSLAVVDDLKYDFIIFSNTLMKCF